MQDRPETDSGHGAWLAKSLSLSQFSEVWLFRLHERNEQNDDREGVGDADFSLWKSLPLSRIKRSN